MRMISPTILIFAVDDSRLLRVKLKMTLFKPGLKSLERRNMDTISPFQPPKGEGSGAIAFLSLLCSRASLLAEK